MDVKVNDLLANIRKSVDSDLDSLTSGTTTQTRGTLMRGALREMRINMGVDPATTATAENEISDLRSRIKRKMAAMEADSFVPPAPLPRPQPRQAATVIPARSDFSGIMSAPATRAPALRGSFAAHDPQEDLRYSTPEPHWQEPPPEVYAQPEPDPFAQQEAYAQGYGYEEPGYQQGYQPQMLEAPIMSPHTEAHAETAFRQLSDAILSRATGDRSLEEMTREMLKGMLKQWLDAHLPAIVEDMVREEIQRVARRGR